MLSAEEGCLVVTGPRRGGCPCDADTRVRFHSSDERTKHKQLTDSRERQSAVSTFGARLLAERHDGADACGSPRGTIRRDTANRKKQNGNSRVGRRIVRCYAEQQSTQRS